ncbi:MAG: hypothetical protein ACRD1A_12225, partial [Terriglobales bacterium]
MGTSRSSRLFAATATIVVVVVATILYLRATPPKTIFGYAPSTSATETHWEQSFRALPQSANIRANMQYLSAYPHNAGSERQHQDAEWVLNKFKSY